MFQQGVTAQVTLSYNAVTDFKIPSAALIRLTSKQNAVFNPDRVYGVCAPPDTMSYCRHW